MVKNHIKDVQQQRQGSYTGAWGLVERAKALSEEEALAAMNDIGKGDSHIENDALGVVAKLKSKAKTQSGQGVY